MEGREPAAAAEVDVAAAAPWRTVRLALAVLLAAQIASTALFAGYDLLVRKEQWATLEHIDWVYRGVQLVELAGIALLSRAPRVARMRGLAWTAFGMTLACTIMEIARAKYFTMARLVDMSSGAGRLFAVSGVIVGVVGAIGQLALLATLARALRSADRRGPMPLVFACALTPIGTLMFYTLSWWAPLGSTETVATVLRVAGYLGRAAHMTLFAWIALVLARARVSGSETNAPEPVDAPIAPEWRGASDALGVYLGGAATRVVLALFGFLAMQGANGSSDPYALRGVRDQIVVIAALSTLSSVIMIGALIRFARVPDPRVSQLAGLAATLFGIGVLVDIGTNATTASALGGDLSSAFFLMDALPWLGAGAIALGVGGGAALLGAIKRAAEHVADPTSAARASSGRVALLVAGGLLVLAFTFLGQAAAAALVPLVLALPLAIVALVRFLQAVGGLRATIALRAAN